MNMSYSIPTVLTVSLVIGLFLILYFARKLVMTRLHGNWLGKAISKVGVLFLAATATYTVLHFSKQLMGYELIAHKFFIIMSAVQVAVFGNVAINQYILTHIKRRAVNDPSIASMQAILMLAAKTTFHMFLFLLTLHNLGVDITALIAGMGVGGIAIALAVQSLLGDLLASLTILLDKPFEVGDSIIVGEFTGELRKIGLKNSRLRLKSGETLIVSNSDLLQSRVRNLVTRKERLVPMKLGVAYETTTEKLKQVPVLIEQVVSRHKSARFGLCHLTEFAESALTFETEYWLSVKDDDWSKLRSEINFGIIEALREAQIEIAYPTRTLYIHQNAQS